MRTIFFNILSLISVFGCYAGECGEVLCVNTDGKSPYRIIVARITEVIQTATNGVKEGILPYEYIGEYSGNVVRISPLRDEDLDDKAYQDVELGQEYVLVVKDIPTLHESCDNSGAIKLYSPGNEITERLWDTPSLMALNINFGKVLPYQTILTLSLPKSTPREIINMREKVRKNMNEGVYNKDRVRSIDEACPVQLYIHDHFNITPKYEFILN